MNKKLTYTQIGTLLHAILDIAPDEEVREDICQAGSEYPKRYNYQARASRVSALAQSRYMDGYRDSIRELESRS